MKKKSDNANDNGSLLGTGSQIDMIKEIIFGPTMREIDKEFKEINKKIDEYNNVNGDSLETLRNDLSKKMEDSESRIMDRLDIMQSEMMDHINKMNEAKTDRRQLSKMLTDLGAKIGA